MPAVFAAVWAALKLVIRKINNFQSRLLLMIFYFLALGPLALLMKRFSDPLAIKPRTLKGWVALNTRDNITPSELLLMATRQS